MADVANYYVARLGCMSPGAVSAETYRALASVPINSDCGRSCVTAIDGTALVMGTLGLAVDGGKGAMLRDVCLEAVCVMVCG